MSAGSSTWRCAACHFDNDELMTTCEMCSTACGAAPAPVPAEPVVWTCGACSMDNAPGTTACTFCQRPRHDRSASNANEWACGTCTCTNPNGVGRCQACGAARAAKRPRAMVPDDVGEAKSLAHGAGAGAGNGAGAGSRAGAGAGAGAGGSRAGSGSRVKTVGHSLVGEDDEAVERAATEQLQGIFDWCRLHSYVVAWIAGRNWADADTPCAVNRLSTLTSAQTLLSRDSRPRVASRWLLGEQRFVNDVCLPLHVSVLTPRAAAMAACSTSTRRQTRPLGSVFAEAMRARHPSRTAGCVLVPISDGCCHGASGLGTEALSQP